MKILFILSAFVFILQAQSAKMTVQEHMSIDNPSSRPSAQFQAKQIMYRIAKVHEKQLEQMVQQETSEEIISEKLTHRGDILYYDVRTKSYKLEVNAMDGAILKKVRNDD